MNKEPPEREMGRQGERFATGLIREILTTEDQLLTNVYLSVRGKETELDNVIINDYGVTIIEVKNYIGEIAGDVEDYEWLITSTSAMGYFSQKMVKNPIVQVRRQIKIVSALLEENGIHAPIRGYTFLVAGNAPVDSPEILHTQSDIGQAIHREWEERISKTDLERIYSLICTAS